MHSLLRKYDSFIPNKIQIKYVKYILGVDKSATNLAVMSELGLFPLTISAIRAALGFWLHTINMDDTFLVKNAFSDNFNLKAYSSFNFLYVLNLLPLTLLSSSNIFNLQ
jgi:hypothetical protein